MSLPLAALEELTRGGQELASPLTFELRANSLRTWGGVIDFNAPEGTVIVPPAVAESLGLTRPDTLVTVRYMPLPKATFVKLCALTPEFKQIRDAKALLEYALTSSYTTLHAGQLITLQHGGREYAALVTAVEPAAAPAVIVLNTDISVEIEYEDGSSKGAQPGAAGSSSNGAEAPDRSSRSSNGGDLAGSASGASHAARQLQRLELGTPSPLCSLAPGEAATFSLRVPPALLRAAASSAGTPHLELLLCREPSPQLGVELYADVDRGTDAAPSLVAHTWAVRSVAPASGTAAAAPAPAPVMLLALDEASVDLPPTAAAATADEHSVVFPLTLRGALRSVDAARPPWHTAGGGPDGGVEAVTLRISVLAAVGGPASSASAARAVFSLQARAVSPAPAAAPPAAAADAPLDGATECPTCGARVPAASQGLHALSCARNNVRCAFPGCGAVLRKAAAGEHWHCGTCGLLATAAEAARHAAQYHSPMPCAACSGGGQFPDLTSLRIHLRSACPHRLVLCRFCGTEGAAGPPPEDYGDRMKGLTGHESYCGSRTAACGGCRQAVRLKDYGAHWAVAHLGAPVLPPSNDLRDYEKGAAARVAFSSSGGGAAGAVAAASAGARHGGGAAAAASHPWQCPACSHANPAGSHACEKCTLSWEAAAPAVRGASPVAGGRPHGGSRSSLSEEELLWGSHGSHGGGAAPHPQARPQPLLLCRNVPCGQPASTRGDAATMGLCSRCFHLFGAEAADADALSVHLVQVYSAQRSRGCGRPACRNAGACRDARGQAGLGEAEMAASVAALVQEATPPRACDARYYVCLPVRALGAGSLSAQGSPALGGLSAAPSAASKASPFAAGAVPEFALPLAAPPGLSVTGVPPRGAKAPGGAKKAAAARVAGAFF